MTRRIPIVPTLVVLIAVAIMIRLGFWQIDRLHQKQAMLARYSVAQGMSADVPWPRTDAERDRALYRRSSLACERVLSMTAVSGRNDKAEPGWAQVARCAIDGGEADVVMGWSRDLAKPAWRGGEVSGYVAAEGKHAVRLIADPPVGGLTANARPDPRDLPNNHLSYAVQWFLFAVTALVIYGLVLRGRWRKEQGEGDGA